MSITRTPTSPLLLQLRLGLLDQLAQLLALSRSIGLRQPALLSQLLLPAPVVVVQVAVSLC